MIDASADWYRGVDAGLGRLFEIVNVAGLFVMSTAAAYFFFAAGLGVRELRRHGVPAAFQAMLRYRSPFGPLTGGLGAGSLESAPAYTLYFIIPCLNESAVIGGTVSALRAPEGWDSRIVVVDDGSDDDTAEIAAAAGGDQVHVVSRTLPDARNGKGAALNTGFAYVRGQVQQRSLDHDRVLVVVMDADGRLSDGAIAEVLPLFADPDVGGAQLSVRIRNRDDKPILRFQDHQFWTLSALTQFGRIGTRTVSLGGNGQFTRLSALLEVGERPWTESLTEDLDLSISLAVRGWALTSTPRAAVDQQGVSGVRALVRQRTRWYQGHMASARRLPEVFGSRRMSHGAALEMVLYLLVPWLFDLPWSLIYHLLLLELGLNAADSGLFSGGPLAIALQATLWYLLAFWPALITACLARRRDPSVSRRHSLLLGHCFLATNYLSYVCAWRALWRMARGQTGWTKTARLAERPASEPEPDLAGQPA